MKTDKEIKKDIKKLASQNPDKYYPTSVLRAEGFIRKQCKKCGTYFWTVNKDQEVCGDSACSGGFRIFENNPAKYKLSYIEVWQKFSEMFKELGYTPIKRYPTVARWNPTAEFTMASIAAFQPYVISGEVEPPAKRLVIPQFSVRFSDIENIGITASHQTGFVMIGQHMFLSKEEWSQEKAFKDIYKWLREGLGLPKEEITFHEDAWAGGGNFGPSMEYFSRGIELGNQVYMMYENTEEGYKELKIKVLDMGMGMERNAWFSQATATQHLAVYPKVINYLLKKIGLKVDEGLMKRFIPLSGMLNVDEVDDINKAWLRVAELLNMNVEELKAKVLPQAALYSIADHTRTLLFTLNDGALPSNVGGGYNLRILIRRAFSFIDKYKWDLDLADVMKVHSEELHPIFPELSENLDNIKKIIDYEKGKYEATKKNIKKEVERIIKIGSITEKDFIELYDSKGITPDLIVEEAKKAGYDWKIPSNFFGRISDLHDKKSQETSTKKEFKLDISNLPETKALYFDDYKLIEFEAKVLKAIDDFVILDQTAFYPTSGGQLHDIGTLNNIEVVDVFKQGPYIVHKLKNNSLKGNDIVKGKIDWERRLQLAQHHTATHIINAAARKVLGNHVNQAGAKKTVEKAHLDITHYKALSDDELKEIERISNEIVNKAIEVRKYFLPRNEAEKRFGMSIYQGGAVPGKKIRIVEIVGVDVEACGGTHLDNTEEVEEIKIIKSTKIQDGIVRIVFTAGKAARSQEESLESTIDTIKDLLGVDKAYILSTAEGLFKVWKKIRKAKKKGRELSDKDLEFKSNVKFEMSSEYLIKELSERLKTQPQYIVNTIKKFLRDVDEYKNKIYKKAT